MRELRDLLDRLLAKDAAPQRATRRRHEVRHLPADPIPERYYSRGARHAFKVLTNAMSDAGIRKGCVIYVRPTSVIDSVAGQIIVCTLNRGRYLRRTGIRGWRRVLESANPRYPALAVTEDDDFALIGVVV